MSQRRSRRASLRARLLAVGLAAAFVPLVPTPSYGQGASGIDRGAADPAVRIQDDAWRAVNGRWFATARIPPDRASVGAAERVEDRVQQRLRDLVADAGRSPGDDPDRRRIADLYASFMDEDRVQRLGTAPVAAQLAAIDAIHDRASLARAFADLDRLGATVPFSVSIHRDAKDSSVYVADLVQDGVGLPDRDYLLANDRRFATIRARYRAFLARIDAMAGVPARRAADEAAAVTALEHAIARAQWDRAATRDPIASYNKLTFAALAKLAPHLDWAAYLDETGIADRTGVVVVSQPGYLAALDRLTATTSLATWRAYLRTHFLSEYAQYLDERFVATRFAMFGTALHGAPENRDRATRGVQLVDESMGEALGRLYVALWFPPADRARIDAMVHRLIEAYDASIDALDWMSESTRREARAKLAALTAKVGYPSRWRDDTALEIRPDDLVGNVERARSFDYRHRIDKLGRAVDRDEWSMTPQTVNAYYDPEDNGIVFPAAFLQPPMFDAAADDAVNYGAIGAMIGHEISHGFDDSGSRYDGHGNLRDWWSAEDRRRFDAKTKALVAQYDAYEPLPGYRVNGALTLGENIADISGLSIAAKAYRLSLGGRAAPVIDGLTGEQRLYIGYAQIWQQKERDETTIAHLKSDPHAPWPIRANATLSNQRGFDEAFGVKPGDRMYRAPDAQVVIW